MAGGRGLRSAAQRPEPPAAERPTGCRSAGGRPECSARGAISCSTVAISSSTSVSSESAECRGADRSGSATSPVRRSGVGCFGRGRRGSVQLVRSSGRLPPLGCHGPCSRNTPAPAVRARQWVRPCPFAQRATTLNRRVFSVSSAPFTGRRVPPAISASCYGDDELSTRLVAQRRREHR